MAIVNKILRRFGVHNAIYDDEYYERDVESPATQAAPYIAKSIVERFSPRSLIDVGCGTGAMMAEIKALGVSVLGLELSNAGIDRCKKRGLEVMKFDIERDLTAITGDVALSVEVAEHLPQSSAERYVKTLTDMAPIVICSAAKPGQGGTDHVNEQPLSYWIPKFESCGFRHDTESVSVLASQWKAGGVAGFYHENLMVFRKV